MIIVRLTWGLWNQLFQYTHWRFLSKKYNQKLFLDYTRYKRSQKYSNLLQITHRNIELQKFNIKWEITYNNKNIPFYEKDYNRKILNNILEKCWSIFKRINKRHILQWKDKIENIKKTYYLEWVYADYKYPQAIREEIIKEITPIKKLDKENLKLIDSMSNKNTTSIHVRRGDYLKIKDKIWICDLEYYTKAIKYIKEKDTKNSKFYIFSDDIDRCKKNFWFLNDWEVEFINHNTWEDSYKDMLLMSNCKNNIIANSTFSWRGSFLNVNKDKIVISPKKPFKDDLKNKKFNDPSFITI